jgi:hypothetical protein
LQTGQKRTHDHERLSGEARRNPPHEGRIGLAAAQPPFSGGLCRGSGRFCGAFPNEGFVQQTDDASHDGSVGEIEDVPAKPDPLRRDVEKDKIGDPLVEERIDGIANRSTNDQAQ